MCTMQWDVGDVKLEASAWRRLQIVNNRQVQSCDLGTDTHKLECIRVQCHWQRSVSVAKDGVAVYCHEQSYAGLPGIPMLQLYILI